jgi:spore coat protein CotH
LVLQQARKNNVRRPCHTSEYELLLQYGSTRSKENMMRFTLIITLIAATALSVAPGNAFQFPPDGFGFGPPGMGGGWSTRTKQKLIEKFDKDGDGRLNTEERKAARASLTSSSRQGFFGGGWGGFPGGFGGMGGSSQQAKPGAKLSPSDVKSGGDAPLYDPNTLRTFFVQFENSDWEKEMEDFYRTDVDVPATLIVDGKTYKDVGVHFRGNSSYSMVSAGQKRSMNISLEYAHKEQKLGGYRTLILLNASMDPGFVHSVLFSEVARAYIPAPKANYARVVINGESWGIYVNLQQFNGDFTREFFKSEGGARWKVPGPNPRGGLQYIGDNPASYKSTYDIKSKDKPKSWEALIALCKTLNQEPPKTLEAALAPMLDIEGALKFLALDVVTVNGDGYWERASDYGIYYDEKGRFHILPSDTNESFGGGEDPNGMFGGGMGFGGFGGFGGPGMGGGAASIDPFAGMDNPQHALTAKLLAVPELRAKYLEIVRDIAEKWLDWERLGPIARRYQAIIADDVKIDARKLYSTEAFESSLKSLESFATARRTYLLPKTKAKSP